MVAAVGTAFHPRNASRAMRPAYALGTRIVTSRVSPGMSET